ncbi:vitellogenin-6 [Trichonephila inaurata madagascariensis]|uniref:Vitellogenin-6 n=1 Tax=Trichonephila inaurata madagascariensis TaxID=2747483 RepID=A0A8X6MKJ1_9ARAC|nr:vitellogenin-6 [Trichonephila inaurata madagascariensis]
MFGLTLLFAALAATASATGYIDGREYVYKYTGQFFSGFPRIKSQFSGYAFHANLIVQPHGDYALLKIDNAQKAQINGEFENIATHPHAYEPLPGQADLLVKPFKVYRKNGIVTHFEVSKGEPSFAVNLKRGLIALFNLNFEEADAGHSTDDNDIQKPDPDRHNYRIYEKGVLGECETAYVIEHHPHYKVPHNNIVLNVTKVRNYHKCIHNPNHVYGTFHGHQCEVPDYQRAHTLHGSAQYKYNIRGHRHHYVIEKIMTTGEIAYTPYPIEGQTVSTTIRRYLTLVEEKPVTTAFDVGAETDTYTSLEYDFDFQKDFKEPIDLKQPHYLYHVLGRKVPLDVIRGQVEELIQAYSDDTYQKKIKDKNFPVKFVELLRSVGTLGYAEIDDLYKVFGDVPKTGATAEQKKFRSLFVDTLVNLGSNPAILFGKYLIENKKAKPQEAAYFFHQLPGHVKEVTQTLLDNIQALCEHENVKKQQSLHISCVLALSNIIFDHCIARYHPENPYSKDKHRCQPENAVKYFDYVAKNFEQTNDEKLKITYLKAAGNIGLREVLPYVRPYIEGVGNHHLYFRSTALWAVTHVGFRFPEKVSDLLVPLLFNQTENYELRLTAFIILMMYRPSLYQMEGLARALKYDPDDQVRSYVYTTLKNLANSTHPCDAKASIDARYALRILEDVHHEFAKYDYSYSTDNYVAGYDRKYDFGGASKFSYFASDKGYIPRTVYLGLDDFIGGKNFRTFAFGFKQYGLEKFLDKIFGPEGSFGRRSVFDLFKKRGKRDAGGVEKELNEIKGKINIPVIDYEPIHGEFFIKYMGNHFSFFHFDDSTFENFFTEGRFSIPNLPALYQRVPQFFYQRFMLTVDKMYLIPSESGIPIIFDYKQPIYYYHKNKESSLKVEPGFFAEERGGKYPDHVKIETDGHIAIDKNLLAFAGSIMPFDQVTFGAGINRRATLSLPLKLKLDLDVKEKKLKTKWTPVAPHEVYYFKYEPYTFVDSYANGVPGVLEEGYKPIQRQNRKQFQESFFHNALGVGFDVNAKYENEFNDKGSWLSFFFDKDYRDKFYYLYANPNFEPYEVAFQFSHAATGATKEVQASIKYNFYDSEYTQPEFSGESFEDYKITDNERGPFCTCELQAELLGLGDKERKAKASFSWTRDLKRSHHKLNIFYDRTPFHSSETTNLKFCGSSYLKYPKYDFTKVATLDTIGMNHKVESALKAHFGKSCTDQKISVVGHFVTTDEQREAESKREVPDTPEHYNPYAYQYQECQKERQKGINYGEHCLEYIRIISTVHGYNFHAKHEDLYPGFLNFTYKVGGFVKHLLYNYADTNEINVENPSNEFHVHANVSLHLPVADIRVIKPKSNSHYTHVFFPKYVGFRSYPVFEDIHIKNSFSDLHCKLEGDNVETFDRYEYKLPPIDCYKIIAKDCSPNEFFTVLGTKITHPRFHKAVKVFLGKNKIEALPVSDDSGIIIRVDGSKVDVSNDQPYLHPGAEGHGPDFYITQRDFYYALHSEKYGIIVEYDGHNIIVQASPFYRAKLCGICGNYNGQKYDGYTTSNGCYYEDETAYAYAYAIPSDTCQVPKFEPKCPNEGGFGCTKLRTKVIDHTTGKVPQTCFSTEPVAECAPHCKARTTTKHKLSFHCLPAKDDSTKSLVRQQPNRILHEFRRKSKDHEAEVEVPDVCLKV